MARRRRRIPDVEGRPRAPPTSPPTESINPGMPPRGPQTELDCVSFGDRVASSVAARSSQLVLGLDPDPASCGRERSSSPTGPGPVHTCACGARRRRPLLAGDRGHRRALRCGQAPGRVLRAARRARLVGASRSRRTRAGSRAARDRRRKAGRHRRHRQGLRAGFLRRDRHAYGPVEGSAPTP